MPSSARVRILIIDDDPSERERCAQFLRSDRRVEYEILEAGGAQQARESIADRRPDCVLMDHSLPGEDSIGFVSELSGAQGRVALPVVLMTAESDADIAVAAIQAGAQDYAVKTRLTPEGLSRSIRNAVEKVNLRRELERKQDALNESRKRELEMKEELLSHVSHELRTPLTAVHQFVSILLDEVAGELNPQQKEFLSVIYKNAKQLRDMIGDLMDVARGGAGKLTVEPTIVALEPLIEDTVQSLNQLAQEKRITLELTAGAALPRVLADAGRVQQVLGNLITNAIKFSPAETTVRVWATPHAVALAPEGGPDFVRVSVQDEGSGIAEEGLDRIFERMHQEPGHTQASRRGLGLGLYICRQLVQGHGGEIWAESRLGQGSIFHFTLPVHSLTRLLRPFLLLEEEPEDGCHLLVVEFTVADLVDPAELDSAFVELRREVESLVHRNRDVVVPRARMQPRRDGPAREMCFVVAHVDAEAARAMGSRLLRALHRSEVVRKFEAEVAIRSHPVPLPPRASIEGHGWLERVSLGVRRAIDAELRSGGLVLP